MAHQITISVSDEAYNALAATAAKKGQTPEDTILAFIAEQQWKEHAKEALQEYEAWSATHEPQYLTEEEFFAELASTPYEESSDADV